MMMQEKNTEIYTGSGQACPTSSIRRKFVLSYTQVLVVGDTSELREWERVPEDHACGVADQTCGLVLYCEYVLGVSLK